MKIKKWMTYLLGMIFVINLASCSNEPELLMTDEASYKLNLYFEYVDANGNNILESILPVPSGDIMTLGSSCLLKRDLGTGYELIKTIAVNEANPYLVNLTTPATKEYDQSFMTRFQIDFSNSSNVNQVDVVEIHWNTKVSVTRSALPSEGEIDKILLNDKEVEYTLKTDKSLKVISIPIL